MSLSSVMLVLMLFVIVITSGVHASAEWKYLPQERSKQIKHQNSDAIRKKGRDLFASLMKMKKEKDFIKSGYGPSVSRTRYLKWEQEAAALDTECLQELDRVGDRNRLQSELLNVCGALI